MTRPFIHQYDAVCTQRSHRTVFRQNTLHKVKMQAITKFESLPNELLIQSFQHLDAIDIFHAFDYLNCRLSTLIRSISLCLDIGGVEKFKVTQFGIKLLLNPQMKEQIMSIILKKDDMLDNLPVLFSFVSLYEFTQLEALVFSNLDTTSIDQISPMLPLLPNLRYFSIDSSLDWRRQISRSLSESTVKTLVIQTIPDQTSLTYPFMSLAHLTVNSCFVRNLCRFFKYTPMLQNLNIKRLTSYDTRSLNQPSALHDHVIHLRQLVVHGYNGELNALEMLLQHTPNLKYFMLHSDGDSDMADANRWCELIKNTLPLLDVFKFLFRFDVEDIDYHVTEKFRLFQTNFWRDQHNWHTVCIMNKDEVLIYTVPYMLDRYEIKSKSERYYSHPINHANVFAKVIYLTVNISAMSAIGQHYFPNVQSLTLTNERVEENHDYAYIKHKHICSLKSMVNLCNITHLEITPKFRWKSPSIICQLINETDHLSSFKTGKTTLFQLLKNRELCERLKMIKKLDISEFWLNPELSCEEIKKVCQIFSNMEEFRCKIDQLDSLQTAIDYLWKLPFMRVFSYKTSDYHLGNGWLKDHQSELKLYSFTISCEYYGINFNDDDDEYDDDDDDDDHFYGYDDGSALSDMD